MRQAQQRPTDRIEGALLGVHAGDALGATVEFSPFSQIRDEYPEGVREIVGGGPFNWPPGHATDDTDLTRAVLLAYLQPGEDVVRTAAGHMLDWLNGRWPGREPGRAPRDIGGATLTGLSTFQRTQDPDTSGRGVGQAGNGSLMRCIPTALAVRDRATRIRESMRISAITHADPRCTVACAAYNEIVAGLLVGVPSKGSVESGRRTALELGSPEVAQAIEKGTRLEPAAMAQTGPAALRDNGAGYVLDSLTLAVAAVIDPRPLPDVLVDIVRLGYDTDTNAAIAGGLLGARDGAKALPAQWVSKLQFGAEFRAAAQSLTASRW